MKKFTAIFLAFAILISMVVPVPVRAASSGGILSGYYGINRTTGLIGQIVPGTSPETVLSRVLGSGTLALSAGVATDSVLSLTQGEAVVDQLSLVVQSDCSGDGQFSITDMLMVKSLLLGQQQFSAAQAQAADVSGDDAVTITDFLQMKSKILGLSDFTVRSLPGAEACNSLILGLGQTGSFGPADAVLHDPAAAAAALAAAETAVPTETASATEPSTGEAAAASETGAAEETTAPTETTSATEPSTGETTVPTEPPETVYLEGNAVSWNAGTITAVALGTSLLRWKDETLLVTVCEEGLKASLPQETLYLGPGTTQPLQLTVNHPVNPSAITYSVSDGNLLSVDDKGNLTGLAEGTATVTVTLPGGVSATRNVHVIRLIDAVTLSESYIKLEPGWTKTLSASFSPAESTEPLIWSSSDPAIASVDGSGVVTAHAMGTVTVTCKTQYGGVTASCKVKVCDLIQVALTYDDGPSVNYTQSMLDLLRQYKVKATFFLVGRRINDSTTAAVKQMAADGHEIGYHTWAHTFFYEMDRKQMQADLDQFQAAVYNASGKYATVYRAPGGGITDLALSLIPMPHIMWSVDTLDWKTRNTEAVRDAIIGGLRDGAIILLHDIHGTTLTGTQAALEYIFAHDLDVQFMTVTELLSRNGTPPQPGTTYKRG